MALSAKPNNYGTLLDSLFKRYSIPLSHPEYQELLAQGENLSRFGQKRSVMEKHFEDCVKKLAESIQAEKSEVIRKEKAIERALEIATERSLAPVKLNNSRLLMTLPFFSPEKRARKEYFEYTSPDSSVKLGVHPSPKYGAAKVWDGDVLMYALSKAVKAYLDTKEFPKRASFTAYEYLKQAGKSPHSKNREILRESLQRLSHTSYECTLIDTNAKRKKGEDHFFLCSAKWLCDENENPKEIEIGFSEELFQYFATKSDLLSLKQGLLLEAWKEERSGLKKRLLMLVGTHLGVQDSWKVGLVILQGKCGHNGELKYFKREFIKLSPSLPWLIDIHKNAKGEDIVTFYPKECEASR